MFSLQVAITILALSTRFDSYAVSGYSLGIPFTVESIEDLSSSSSSSVESNTSYETTTPCPTADTLNTPVIETTTAPIPTYDISDQFGTIPDAHQFAVVQQNFNITGPTTHNRKRTSCLCKECNPENGFYIKHFRQYNYYYPHGRGIGGHHIPHHLNIFNSDEFLPSDDVPIASSVVTANNVNVVSSRKKSSRPTVRYSPPGVTSYVPNNGFNSIYHNHQFTSENRQHQNDDEHGRESSSVSEENSSNNGEQTSSDESPEQKSEQPQTHPDIESATTIPLDDNVSEDIISYLSEPNVFGHARTTTHNNGNNHSFQSHRVSVSSHLKSQPQNYADSNAQQQIGISSGVRSQSSSHQQQQEAGSSSRSHQSSSESQQQESVTSNTHHQSQPESSSVAQQQTSISSRTQHELPIVSNSESQQQEETSSSAYETIPIFGPSSINWANDFNFGSPNNIAVGYNPYFQSQPFGVLPRVQPPLPPVSISGPRNPINWMKKPSTSTAPLQSHLKPSPCQCNNRVKNWPNFSIPPPPLPIFDFTSMSPSYSVIL